MPRSWYGEYLQELLNHLLNQTDAVVKKDTVTSIRLTDDRKYVVKTETEEETVNCIHLATGHLAYQDPYKLKGKKNYIHLPYPVIEKVKDIPVDSSVAILGTGLTAIDLMNYLRNKSPKMKIAMVSPDGKFSSVRGSKSEHTLSYLTVERLEAEKNKHEGMVPFKIIKRLFTEEVNSLGLDLKKIWSSYGIGTVEGLRFDLEHLDEIGKFQSIIASMKDLYAEMWNLLSEAGREEFLTDYAERFLAFRSPIPTTSAQKIIDSVDRGYVKVYKDIKDIKKDKDVFHINFTSSDVSLEADYLLNGTGQSADLKENWHEQDILIQQLLNERILTPYSHGGVQIIYPDMSVISQRYGVLSSFKAYGQLVSGINYFNNTVGLISQGAINGVKSMVDELTNETIHENFTK